jgi:hypothetical protein
VQNAGQVNIASDGGQQVNVQKSKRRAKASRGKTSGKRGGTKQLASKSADESIRMESASNVVVGKG